MYLNRRPLFNNVVRNPLARIITTSLLKAKLCQQRLPQFEVSSPSCKDGIANQRMLSRSPVINALSVDLMSLVALGSNTGNAYNAYLFFMAFLARWRRDLTPWKPLLNTVCFWQGSSKCFVQEPWKQMRCKGCRGMNLSSGMNVCSGLK